MRRRSYREAGTGTTVIKSIFHATIEWVISITALLGVVVLVLFGFVLAVLAILWPVVCVVLGLWIYHTYIG